MNKKEKRAAFATAHINVPLSEEYIFLFKSAISAIFPKRNKT